MGLRPYDCQKAIKSLFELSLERDVSVKDILNVVNESAISSTGKFCCVVYDENSCKPVCVKDEIEGIYFLDIVADKSKEMNREELDSFIKRYLECNMCKEGIAVVDLVHSEDARSIFDVKYSDGGRYTVYIELLGYNGGEESCS